jgi:hypothetical protein
MTKQSTIFLKVLYVVSWIIFIGLCIEAGVIIFNAIFTLVIKPESANIYWQEIDLSGLHAFDAGYFLTETVLMSIVAVMQAILFYLIVKILHDKKLNLAQPFNKEIERFIGNMAYLSIGIGIFCYWGANYTKWLISKGIAMPDLQTLRLGGADVWLFMGITLLVIAQVFKRGVEIQKENDLTI